MNLFDRFAARVSDITAGAAYFALCLFAVIAWAASGPIFGFNDTWQLVINTSTTIFTFLTVALIQNDQARFERATNIKLDAIAEALAGSLDDEDACRELRRASGIEKNVSASS